MGKEKTEEQKKISVLAERILKLAQDDILIHLRFLDRALAGLVWKEGLPVRGNAADGNAIHGYAMDGNICHYDPVFLLRSYREEPPSVARSYLHLLLHCIFAHNFRYDKLERELWDLSADIAVEHVILELGLSSVRLKQDEEEAGKLRTLQEDAGALTAERLYRYFKNNPPSEREREELCRLFARDAHMLWETKETLELGAQQWRKISERIKAELRAFAKAKSGTAALEKNLEETTRERYDYGEILRRFTVAGEEIAVNDEEFDTVYYTYGLAHYGNLPLIEPLEYKEVRKVKEFVIALDTSASCRDGTVKAFLQKTYAILKGSENFFHKINVHIIQCDSEVQSDTKITGDEDFERFLRYGKLNGFGGTDFRPVFSYVEELRDRGEFENLKGLIYFTDGYGIYPERMPDYDVIFAFLDEDEHRMPVPPWSMQVVVGG